jgi:hypothetical protein
MSMQNVIVLNGCLKQFWCLCSGITNPPNLVRDYKSGLMCKFFSPLVGICNPRPTLKWICNPRNRELYLSMGFKYTITSREKYFLTITVVDWIDVFTRKELSEVIINALRYCQQHKNLQIYAWCLMPSHLH